MKTILYNPYGHIYGEPCYEYQDNEIIADYTDEKIDCVEICDEVVCFGCWMPKAPWMP